MRASSDGLVGTTKEGPGEPERKGDRRRKQQGAEEASHLGHAQRDHDGQVSPLWRLKSERVWDGAWDGKGFQRFFPSLCFS